MSTQGSGTQPTGASASTAAAAEQQASSKQQQRQQQHTQQQQAAEPPSEEEESSEEPAQPTPSSSRVNVAASSSTNILQEDPTTISSVVPYPHPDLYFKVNDSELDEPRAKIRRDVNKLYDRWLEKYGRRWPENGLNTEDLVWLQEEAYKPAAVADGAADGGLAEPGSSRSGLIQLEKSEYPDEFISEPEGGAAEGEVDADGNVVPKSASGKASAGTRRPISNYEATKAGATWVSDSQFESDEYEAGNLETLWDMHLWDREGQPIMMPQGPPDDAAGEESEEFDDFYTAYRPRTVNSEEAREAVWATDEFESDEDNTESEWEPEYVGAGLGLDAEDPINPQYSLRHSNHPLAPFPGEGLKWSSYVFDDGTTYEGLTRDAVAHGMGVMIFGNGTGGGFHFRDVRRGDKYEGEFQVGYAHGLGQFTSEKTGEVYIGEFFAGQRHGCGIRIDMKPLYYLLERGEDPTTAYNKTYDSIMRNIEFRTWYRNKKLGSDGEEDAVFWGIRDELDNPIQTIVKADMHEAKLKEWKNMGPRERAMNKMVEIIESVGSQRIARRMANVGTPDYFVRNPTDGGLVEVLDSMGNDTEYDSVDLMIGEQSDGRPGLGWIGNEDSEQYPWDATLLEAIANDVAQDKMEESEDKEMILGQDLVNPFTGLTLKDYLDGKESKHLEFLAKTGNWDAQLGEAPLSNGGGLLTGTGVAPAAIGLGQAGEQVPEEWMEAAKLWSQFTPAEQDKLRGLMDRLDKAYAESPYARPAPTADRNPFSEDTDTRFETESDFMDLCDLNEILGTVDEAKEVVAKARMWRWKPDGEVTLRFAQDANGTPLPLMQDPLHYPHGTKFLAPGPLGQCHPIPDDETLRANMLAVAHNYNHIHSLYNFDWDPEPGSVQYMIDQRIKRAHDLRMQTMQHMEEAVEEELAAQEQQQQQPAGQELAQLAAASRASSPFAAATSSWWRPARPAVAGGPLASISFGMGRATHVIMGALTNVAKHAPARRPRLMRPWQLRQQQQQRQRAQGRV